MAGSTDPESWAKLIEALRDMPPAIMALAPTALVIWAILKVTQLRGQDQISVQPKAENDSDKLDKILSELATLRADMAHLAKMEASVQTLIKDVAHIEGRLDARK